VYNRDFKGGGEPDYLDRDDDGDGRKSPKRYTQLSERNRCRFTRAGVDRIDYKDVVTLQKLMTNQARIFSRKRSGNAARFQRMVRTAIKRARFMALLPYTG
jgi:small subunit ribosomal protein S18